MLFGCSQNRKDQAYLICLLKINSGLALTEGPGSFYSLYNSGSLDYNDVKLFIYLVFCITPLADQSGLASIIAFSLQSTKNEST